MHAHTRKLFPVSLTLAFVAAACSSSDDSDSDENIQALSAPEGVAVVEADESEVSTGATFPNAGSSFPVDSDYVLDAASIHVFDPSIRSVENANNILCEVAYTRFPHFVNEPPYKAQLDTTLCGQQPQSTGEGDGLNPVIHVFTLDVDRPSNDAPQHADVWLPLDENDTPVVINATMDVTVAPSAADRFGAFNLTFAAVPDGGVVTDPAFYGVLLSDDGETGFRFLEASGDVTVPAANPGDQADRKRIALSQDATTGQGAAKVEITERYNNGGGDTTDTVTWRVVFDEDNVLRQRDADAPVALSRGDYRNHVYGYNLYYADGADMGERVSLFSGVGVELPSGEYGWVGYYGAWAPHGESFDDGDVVVSHDNDTSYTVVAAPGRLMRQTRDSLLLTELGGQIFEWWDSGDRFRVDYDGSDWRRVQEWNDMTEQWDDIIPPTVINVAADAGGFLGMWSPFLGGVNYRDGDADITFFSSALVSGSDPVFANGAIEIFATVNGLKSEIDLTEANNGDVYLADAANPASAHKYRFDPATMTLQLDVNGDGTLYENVGLANGVEPTMGPNTWGMNSGPMVLEADVLALANIYDIFDEEEFYTYETGHNSWNQSIALVDAMNEFVTFDPPIEFLYTHSTANDMNDDATYNGRQALLSYNGPGKLFGIPGEEIDLGGGERRYLPNFSIADGVLMGPMGTEYIVRAIGVEQTLEVDPGGAPQLDISDADALVLPAESIYVTPQIGAQPVVPGPPAVVDGVLQADLQQQ